MKIKNGFISNSSSSSFILYKKNLLPNQLKVIKRFADIANNDNSGTIITESTDAFYGKMSYNNEYIIAYLICEEIKDYSLDD